METNNQNSGNGNRPEEGQPQRQQEGAGYTPQTRARATKSG
jgi:hypothetical protein